MDDRVDPRLDSHARIVDAGGIDDFPDGIPTLVRLDGRRVCVVRDGGEVYAFDDRCPHEDASLSDGWFEDGTIACPSHAARFECRSGVALSMPATSPLELVPVTVADRRILLHTQPPPLDHRWTMT